MRVYLSGPMTGYPAFNAPAFAEAAALLRSSGYFVVSPLEIDQSIGLKPEESEHGSLADLPKGHTQGSLLARDVQILFDDNIDGIVCLQGWIHSKGSRLEVICGLLKRMKFYMICNSELFEIPAEEMLKGVVAGFVQEELHERIIKD